MNANTIPLQEIIPWSPNDPRNILVCDSIETDGSFVLSTMTAQLFSTALSPQPSSTRIQVKGVGQQQTSMPRALWLSGNASTEKQVAMTLKKLGCDAGASYLRKSNSDATNIQNSHSGLMIRSLASEISGLIVKDNNENDKGGNSRFNNEKYLQSVYKDVKAWVTHSKDDTMHEDGPDSKANISWIIFDDVTALAAILGETLVYSFVESLISMVNRQDKSNSRQCGFIVRCSGDLDQILYRTEVNEKNDHSGWFGAGGLSHKHATHDTLYRTFVPWERAIEESVDAIIDVLPLLSGFSREAHGRLIFSETPNGRGWSDQQNRVSRISSISIGLTSKASSRTNTTNNSNWNKLIFNYRLQDNGARAIRLRAR
mmetsp:Transcript_649/g.1539  ORF Transcript_649/g.1539 Transcript_649/m.1539 type:complete len:371 (-) Transcript_649:1611-2723(-)